MLSLNYYSGSINGANYQKDNAPTITRREAVISIINKVCNKYSIDESIMMNILEKYPNEFIGYVLNSNDDVKTDKTIQNIIIDTLEEEGNIYDEDVIDDILTSLDIC